MSNSDNATTLWLQSDLNRQAYNKAAQAIAATGRALPCTVVAVNGSLVTVKFEVSSAPWTLPNLTLPKGESQWLRAPVQVGDVGMTLPADTFLGGVTGLGAGVADLTKDYGNLATLVWVPVAAVAFGPPPDPNKAWINGPNGSVLSDTAQTVGVSADHGAGVVTIYAGQETIVLAADPSITATVSGAAGALQSVIDGPSNAISHIVPSGGLVGLGALAGSLPATAAAITNNDVATFENSLHSQRLSDLENLATAVSEGLAQASPAVTLPASTIIGLIASLAHISVPSGSSIVRVGGG